MSAVRSGPLSFSQQAYFLYHRRLTEEARWVPNLKWHWQPPRETTLDTVAAAVRTLTARHETLRTRYPSDASGRPTQLVTEPDRSTAEPPALYDRDTAYAVAEELWRREFMLGEETPVRFVVVGTEQAAREVICIVHHIAIDDVGVELLSDEFMALVARPAGETVVGAPPVARGMVDIADAQRRPAMQARSEGAVKYWRRLVGETTFRLEGSGAKSRDFQMVLNSRSARRDTVRLARRLKLPEFSVVLAAFSHALRSYSGLRRFGVLAPFANRVSRSERQTVGCLYQMSPIVVDTTDDPSFADLTQRSAQAVMTAGRYARYDVYRWAEELAEFGFEHPLFENRITFNYLAHLFREKPDGSSAAPATADGHVPRWETADAPDLLEPALKLTVEPRGPAMSLSLTARGRVMGESDARSFLLEIERVLARAAEQHGV